MSDPSTPSLLSQPILLAGIGVAGAIGLILGVVLLFAYLRRRSKAKRVQGRARSESHARKIMYDKEGLEMQGPPGLRTRSRSGSASTGSAKYGKTHHGDSVWSFGDMSVFEKGTLNGSVDSFQTENKPRQPATAVFARSKLTASVVFPNTPETPDRLSFHFPQQRNAAKVPDLQRPSPSAKSTPPRGRALAVQHGRELSRDEIYEHHVATGTLPLPFARDSAAFPASERSDSREGSRSPTHSRERSSSSSPAGRGRSMDRTLGPDGRPLHHRSQSNLSLSSNLPSKPSPLNPLASSGAHTHLSPFGAQADSDLPTPRRPRIHNRLPSVSSLFNATANTIRNSTISITPSILSSQRAGAASPNPFSNVRKVKSAFTPLLPDELVLTIGERVTVIQAFDDEWCVVARATGAAGSHGLGEMGACPASCFEKPPKAGKEHPRLMRSSSLGVTVMLEQPSPGSRDEVMSWSNF